MKLSSRGAYDIAVIGERRPDVSHARVGKRRDERPEPSLCHGLNVVEIDRTLAGHSVGCPEYHLGRYLPDRRRYRGNRDLAQKIDDRITRQHDNRPPLVG
jgi:hypothetical protein